MKHLLVLLGLSLLGGCATYQWRHATRYDANFDEESYACKKEAAQAFPAKAAERVTRPSRMVQPGFVCPPGVSDHNKCSWRASYWTATETESYDLNESAREDMYSSCLKARGWIRYRVD